VDGLTSPFELLELQDGESVNFRAERYEKAETTIVPKHLPTGKRVTALRVHIRHEDKPTFPYYWDLTASTLVAQIEPHLRREDLARLRFTITARGIGPKKRFSVDVAPAL
jgi:hypothetical protein